MSLTHVNSVSQLNRILTDSDKLTVVDFHASWCGPCHAIAPTFEALAKEYPNVNFVKCDVDAARDVASAYKVTAMPTFLFFKGSNQVHMIRGANKAALQNAVKQFAGSSSGAGVFSGQGHTLGETSPPVTHDLVNTASSIWSNMDPALKILLGLLAIYVFLWLM